MLDSTYGASTMLFYVDKHPDTLAMPPQVYWPGCKDDKDAHPIAAYYKLIQGGILCFLADDRPRVGCRSDEEHDN